VAWIRKEDAREVTSTHNTRDTSRRAPEQIGISEERKVVRMRPLYRGSGGRFQLTVKPEYSATTSCQMELVATLG
jgi:hypothetical protein